MNQDRAALIASGILASICVILVILLVYLYRVYVRKSEPKSSRHHIKHADIPPFTPDCTLVQPLLKNTDDSKITSKSHENLEEDLDRHLYAMNTGVFHHGLVKRSNSDPKLSTESPSHVKSSENLHFNIPPLAQHRKLERQGVSRSTDNLALKSNHDKCNESKKKNYHVHLPLTNSVSLQNLNAPVTSPPIRRIKTHHHNRSSQYRDLSPLCRGIISHPLTRGSSSESIGNSDSHHQDENSQVVTDVKEQRPSLGEMLVSLCHNPCEGKLTIKIKSCEGLHGVSRSGKINPFVKIRIYDCGERKYNKKTSIKEDTTSPIFNESFDFIVTGSRMPQTSIILRLYHHRHHSSPLHKDLLIGVVFLGQEFELIGPNPFNLDHGANHWASVIQNPHLVIEEWHSIQAFPSSTHPTSLGEKLSD